jgi:hypothetical protein
MIEGAIAKKNENNGGWNHKKNPILKMMMKSKQNSNFINYLK